MNYFLWGILGYGIYNILNSKSVQSQDTIPTETGKHVVLENAKYNYFASPDHGGNPRAKNIFGEGKFNYQNTIQNKVIEDAYAEDGRFVLDTYGIGNDRIKTISDKKIELVGLECNAVSILNLYKSLGLIYPSWKSNRFEDEFTNIFIDANLLNIEDRRPAKNTDYSIPKELNADLRGFKEADAKKIGLSFYKIQTKDYCVIAQELARFSSYAERTGMKNKKFEVKIFRTNTGSLDYKEMEKYIKDGKVIRLSITYKPDGHYVIMNDISIAKNMFICDDPLNGKDKQYSLDRIQEAWTLDVV